MTWTARRRPTWDVHGSTTTTSRVHVAFTTTTTTTSTSTSTWTSRTTSHVYDHDHDGCGERSAPCHPREHRDDSLEEGRGLDELALLQEAERSEGVDDRGTFQRRAARDHLASRSAFPLPSAMLSGTDKAARRIGSLSARYPAGRASRGERPARGTAPRTDTHRAAESRTYRPIGNRSLHVASNQPKPSWTWSWS